VKTKILFQIFFGGKGVKINEKVVVVFTITKNLTARQICAGTVYFLLEHVIRKRGSVLLDI